MQQVFQGRGSLKTMISHLTGSGNHRVFLVSGSHFREAVADYFPQPGNLEHYVKKGANVHEREVEEVVMRFRETGATIVLAVGGGSVIDLGKMIISRGAGKQPTMKLAAAPTTTGSGSEATQFAVLYEHQKKRSVSDPQLLPSFVALDPDLVDSLPPYQAAVSGMDALSQAVESWWSRAAVPAAKKYAESAIEIWRDCFLSSLQNTDPTARERMLVAAHYAGQAIQFTRTTGPHALSYYLTAAYGVPHGQAVAIFLPVFFLYNQPAADLCRLFGATSPAEAAEQIWTIMKKAGLATRLAALGVEKEKAADLLLAEVNEERFANNPVAFDPARLRELIMEYL